MKRTSFVLLLILLFGCDTIGIFDGDDGLEAEFFLTDAAGRKTTTFEVGSDIGFHYAIKNRTSRQLRFQNPDPGPVVTIEVVKDGLVIGTNHDGFGYPAIIVVDTLLSGATLTLDYNWFLNESHAALPPGEYVARARPRLQFDSEPGPAPATIAFTVTCDAECDSDNFVIVTDQPPDSIQLDPFQLRSVALSGDLLSLEIAHSGGCREHSYDLFMSPAAFLESFPVQANLFLRHNANGDACEALIETTVTFNVQPIARLYQNFYGQKDEILLNVFEFFEDQPGAHQQVSYLPN